MTEETTPTHVTVELSVEAAYEQLVAFQAAAKAYRDADEAEDLQGKLDAADKAVDSFVDLINDLMPYELSVELHERLDNEHPELAEPAQSLEDIMRALMGAE